jgi:hypothetical protein
MFVAAELFIMDFNVYTAELSHTDFKSRNIKATVKCLNIFTELYVQYIYSYTVLQHLFFLSPSYYSKVWPEYRPPPLPQKLKKLKK